MTRCHHLDNGVQAGACQFAPGTTTKKLAGLQRMIAQAVAFLQQHQAAFIQFGGVEAAFGRFARRVGDHEAVMKQWHFRDIPTGEG